MIKEQPSFGIGRPACKVPAPLGVITYRSLFIPGRNEIRHDALVAVSSLPDSREIIGRLVPVKQLPQEWWHYTLPSRDCHSDNC